MKKPMSFRRPTGFTLVELLIVISIIAILSSLMLVVLRDASESVAASRTARTVDRIKVLLKQKLESIAARPLPFSLKAFPDAVTWEQARYLRLRHLMESVRAEMPCHFEMIAQVPSVQSRSLFGTAGQPTYWSASNATYYRDLMLARPPAALIAHRLSLQAPGTPGEPFMPLDTKGNGLQDDDNARTGEVATDPLELFPLRENPNLASTVKAPGTLFDHSLIEGSECLFSILYNTINDGSRGTQMLAPGEIGDLDEDGRPEVLDAWGEPLYFSIVVNRYDLTLDPTNSGFQLDRNGDSKADYVDGQLDPNFPAELGQYRIVVYSLHGSEHD